MVGVIAVVLTKSTHISHFNPKVRRMKTLCTLLCIIMIPATHAFSQDDPAREERFRKEAAMAGKDTMFGWKHEMVSGLNLTQVSFKDWAQGGENALSYTLWLSGKSTQSMEMTSWANSYRMAFGQTRLGNQGLRKTDDEIYFESLLIYKLGVTVNPYGSFTFRTQFAKGFKYADDGSRTAVSQFFDPAYLTQSVGVAYSPTKEVTTRLGAGAREVITSQFTLYSDDPKTLNEVEKVKVEGGLESVTDVSWGFAENMLLKSTLEMFAPFNALDEIVVRNNTSISAKVNQYVTVNLSVQLINDITVTRKTQIKEALAIGVSYNLL